MEAEEQFRQGAFSCPRLPHDGDALTGLHVQRNRGQGLRAIFFILEAYILERDLAAYIS
jgi:hypothetical protein